MQRFVPENIMFGFIGRSEYKVCHTEFANALSNLQPEGAKVLIYIDADILISRIAITLALSDNLIAYINIAI